MIRPTAPLTVATTFFLAEMGDKTMLATVTIASQQQSFGGVWIGSTLGMVLADGIAIVIGKALGRRLPERPIKYGAALVFIVSGIVTICALHSSAEIIAVSLESP